MHKLMDFICDELKEYEKKADKGEISKSDLQYIDTLAHAGKNIAKIMESCGESEYSNYSGRSYRSGSSYDNGASYRSDGQSYVRPDGSYNHQMYSERGRSRDSMGRYSGSEGFKNELYRLMNEAPDDRTRREFEKFIDKMDTM